MRFFLVFFYFFARGNVFFYVARGPVPRERSVSLHTPSRGGLSPAISPGRRDLPVSISCRCRDKDVPPTGRRDLLVSLHSAARKAAGLVLFFLIGWLSSFVFQFSDARFKFGVARFRLDKALLPLGVAVFQFGVAFSEPLPLSNLE